MSRRAYGAAAVPSALLLAGVGMGAVIAFGPTWLPLAIVAGLVLVLATREARRVLHRGNVDSDQTDNALRRSRARDPLRVARFLFYGGMLSIAELAIRPAAGITLSDLLFFTALLLTLIHYVAERQLTRRAWSPTLVAGGWLFTAGALLALLNAESAMGTVGILIRVLYLVFVWSWLGAALLQTPRQLRTAIGCWVASAAITSAYAVAQSLGAPGGTVEPGRFGGLTDHVNDLGGVAAITLLPALVLVGRPNISLVKRLLAGAALGLIAIGLVFSGSVGGAIAACVGAAVLLISRQLARAVVGVLVAGAVGFVFFAPSTDVVRSPIARLSTVTKPPSRQGGGTLRLRIDSYELAWQRIKDHPIVGVGLDPKSSTVQTGDQVHNLLLGRWYEAGVLGLLGMTLMIWSFLASGWRATRSAESREELLIALGLLAAIVAFISFGMSEPILYKRFGLAPVALMLALLAQQSARQPARGVGAGEQRRAGYLGPLAPGTARTG